MSSHVWQLVGENTEGYVAWCKACGRIGTCDIAHGLSGEPITKVTDIESPVNLLVLNPDNIRCIRENL